VSTFLGILVRTWNCNGSQCADPHAHEENAMVRNELSPKSNRSGKCSRKWTVVLILFGLQFTAHRYFLRFSDRMTVLRIPEDLFSIPGTGCFGIRVTPIAEPFD
jgi:hypothetical protein